MMTNCVITLLYRFMRTNSSVKAFYDYASAKITSSIIKELGTAVTVK